MVQTRCSERMSRLISEHVELAPPILDTSASTIVDLACRKISHNGRRDCTAERLRQDRYVHSGVWPVPSDNRRGGDGIESRKETDRSRSIRTAETVADVVDAGPRSAIAATTIRAMAGCQCSEFASIRKFVYCFPNGGQALETEDRRSRIHLAPHRRHRE